MQKTPLYQKHIDSGAKIVPFGGFLMPLEYTGIRNEHMAVRNTAGLFDVSHMGEIWVKGAGAKDFLQRVTCNDVEKLHPGQAQYTCLLNSDAGILDDLLIYCYDPEKYMLVVNASNINNDWDWLKQQESENLVLENASDKISLLAIQGPQANKILQRLTDADLSSIPYYSFITHSLAGVKEVIISNTGYTGAGGFEIYAYNENVVQIWDAIMEVGKPENIMPAGLGARDTLRLEMGFCLHGNDIDESTTPLEAGLGWVTKLEKKSDFIGREPLIKQKKDGVSRRLRAFIMEEKGIPRKGYQITDLQDNIIGEVTSGSISPVLDNGIGLGYIQSGTLKIGDEIRILIRNRSIKARIVKPPFI
ncbi:glycine cleavage system aminomethyltransferase GcvT [Alkalitalea saponilacus]|uniref:Aminomethyltransferase n=1 Tax=Alkalitalea saponilacus TaxID=889453 RepID=A0A1T5HAF1_9BACT|nr:glycine cleavage system aminomethyltransferase GcvT [Alkalitalea saponilacus]ASB50797.1 glycine cleavage system protein T [Alkalitalea saponilacus]SKC17668.1 aminomethyltransferase [Alkalitalea saponilacus]